MALKPPGFHTTAREPKRAHLRVPAFNHTTKIQKRRPPEREKERKWRREREKRAKFWAVQRRAVRRRAVPREGGPARGRSCGRAVRTTQTTPPHTIWIFTPRKSGPHTTHTTHNTHTATHTHTNTTVICVVWAGRPKSVGPNSVWA